MNVKFDPEWISKPHNANESIARMALARAAYYRALDLGKSETVAVYLSRKAGHGENVEFVA